jgi:CHAD domain-containing protein
MRSKSHLSVYPRKIISRYLEHFVREREDVLRSSGDIEPVHRMRVASRRLRAALDVFKDILPEEKAGIWREELKDIGRALGRARELDIQIRFLKDIQKKEKRGLRIVALRGIIKSFRKKRRWAQEGIDDKLRGFEPKKRLPGLKAWLKERSGAKRHVGARAFEARKEAILLKRFEHLRKLSSYAFRPQNSKELHLLRIAAKKLRYTLEILRPWYGAGIDQYIRVCRDIQDLLGDVHELDVLTHAMSDFPKNQDKDSSATIAYVKGTCAFLRQGVYVKFLRLWKRLRRERLWEALRECLKARGLGQGDSS